MGGGNGVARFRREILLCRRRQLYNRRAARRKPAVLEGGALAPRGRERLAALAERVLHPHRRAYAAPLAFPVAETRRHEPPSVRPPHPRPGTDAAAAAGPPVPDPRRRRRRGRPPVGR